MRKLMCLLLSLVMMLALPLGYIAEELEGPAVEEIQQELVAEPDPAPVVESAPEPEPTAEPKPTPIQDPTPTQEPTPELAPTSEPDPTPEPATSPEGDISTPPVDAPTQAPEEPSEGTEIEKEQDTPAENPVDQTPAIRFEFEEGEEEQIEAYVGERLTVPYILSDTVAANAPEVLWSSSNENMAIVDEKTGEIEALSPGETDITAELPDGESASFLLVIIQKDTNEESKSVEEAPDKVIPLKQESYILTLLQTSAEISVGETISVSYTLVPEEAEVTEAENDIEPMLPVITWTSSDEAIATVDTEGVVTGVAPGNIQVIAMLENGSTQSLDVSVAEAQPDFVSIINAGQVLDVALLLGRAAPDLTASRWVSRDEALAMILEDGMVMALAEGSVIVDAYGETEEVIFSVRMDIQPPLPGDEQIQGTYLYWNFSGGTLHIWGNDVMPSFTPSNRPWTAYLGSIQRVLLTNVQDIGTYAFANCTALTTVDGLASVRKIGENAFSGCTALTTFSFPGTVARVERRTFYGCTALSTITLPSTVTAIDAEAFSGCTALTAANLLTTNVASLGTSAFAGCTSLRNISFPSTLRAIPDYAFQGCISLPSIAIPPTLPTVGVSAFSGCTALTTVTIAEGVTTLGNSAFAGCTSLPGVSLPSSVTTVGVGLFRNCTSLRNFYASGLIAIADEMFYGCTSLDQLPLYPTVTHIGNRAFQGCTGLINIVIPDHVLTMGTYAFSGCTGMTSATISGSLGVIPAFTFNLCNTLGSVNIGTGITIIDESAFNRCERLANVTLPATLVTINKSAFEACGALSSIILPDSVTDIGESVFANCRVLSNIQLSNNLRAISNRAFYYCTALTNIAIPNSVTAIGNSAFEGCEGLTQMLLPPSLQSIGNAAFLDCKKLKTLQFSEGLLSIGADAFKNCTVLESPALPNALTTIASGAFFNCPALVNMVIPPNVISIGDSAFFSSPLNFVVFQGNAPRMGANVFGNGGVKKIKYYRGRANFATPIWQSFPCYPIVDPTPFVTSIYTVALGRTPSFDDVIGWRNDIFFEKVTGASMVEGFLLRGEFPARNVDTRTFIISVYQACFDRTPSSDEIDAWLRVFDEGNTRRFMIHGVMASPEYTNLIASLGISLGTLPKSTVSDKNPNLAKFVGRMYTILLERYATDREIDAWVGDLLSGATSGTRAMEGVVLNSPEFTNIIMTDREYVARLYQVLVGRRADTREEDAWLADITKLGGRIPAFYTFVSSPEYIALMAFYGVKP